MRAWHGSWLVTVVIRRLCHVAPLLLSLTGLLLVGGLGCADRIEGMDTGGLASADGGVRSDDDAAARDAGAASDATFDPDHLAEADCFDFTDDDGDGRVDCDDRGCGTAAICCALGSDRDACCVAQAAAGLDLSACASGDDARLCALGVASFGTSPLTLRDDLGASCTSEPVLVPADNVEADTGLVLGEILDPAVSRIRVGMALGGAAGDGLARIGVGLVADTTQRGRVVPLVAVVLSAGEIRLAIGEVEVPVAELAGSACEAAVPVELIVDPSGSVEVRVEGTSVFMGSLPSLSRSRLAVYGRHGAGDPAAWVSGVTVQRDVCSVLSPERATSPVLFGASPTARLGRVSVARRPGELGRAAVELDGRILPGTEVEGGIRIDDMDNPLVVVDVERTGPDWAAGASDPQLRVTTDGYQLLFAGQDADGSTHLFAMSFSATLGSPSTAVAVLSVDDAAELASGQFIAIDEPTYFERGGHGFLLYRAIATDYTELRIADVSSVLADALAAEAPPSLSSRDATYAEGMSAGVLRRSGDGDGFDRDEIGAARVLDLGDGVVRIFYAGRRGTRWSIGALVTTDLLHYDQVAEGTPLLGPSGAGFDALGVRSPELLAGPVAFGVAELTMYYTASAGTVSSLGLATQAIRVGATP